MNSESKQHRLGTSALVVLSAIAMILVAAATENDANWERLRAMPPEERTRLLGNLRKFDLELTPEQQAAVRDIDRRLSELEPDRRAEYLSVLRRYHDWLNGLPENRQDELAVKPPAERMALVRKLLGDRPLPAGDTPQFLRVVEPGEFSPFEVASAYRIWQALSANERAKVEQVKQEHARRVALFGVGARPRHAIPRETRPDDYDEETWIGEVKNYWRKSRPVLSMEDLARKKFEDAGKKARADAILHEVQKRQAINLYVSRTKVDPVAPERLVRFVSALPEWIQSSFDPLPPDEARHRLAFAYRLVFPHPQEIGATPKSAGPASKGRTAPLPGPAAPARAKRTPAGTKKGASPF